MRVDPEERDQDQVAVAALPGGGFVVVWEIDLADGWEVRGRRFAGPGTPLGGPFPVAEDPSGDRRRPRVAAHPDGSFAVSWEGPDDDGTGVWIRRFAADGTPLGGDQLVNATTSATQYLADLAATPEGGLVVVWAGIGDGEAGTLVRTFDADGDPTTGEVRLTPSGFGYGFDPAVAPLAGGGFLVAWTDDRDLFARRLTAAGQPDGDGFQISVGPSIQGENREPQLAGAGDGGFVLGWKHTNTLETYSYRFRRYLAAGTSPWQVDAVQYVTSRDAAFAMTPAVEILASWGGRAIPARLSGSGWDPTAISSFNPS